MLAYFASKSVTIMPNKLERLALKNRSSLDSIPISLNLISNPLG
jgi:hypothetical protein